MSRKSSSLGTGIRVDDEGLDTSDYHLSRDQMLGARTPQNGRVGTPATGTLLSPGPSSAAERTDGDRPCPGRQDIARRTAAIEEERT